MRDTVAIDRPFDPGLQPERVLLAWQRTVLSLAIAFAVALRFIAPQVGSLALIEGIAGLILAAAAYIGVQFRYRRAHRALCHSASLDGVSTWPLAVLAASTLVLGALGAFFVWGNIRP